MVLYKPITKSLNKPKTKSLNKTTLKKITTADKFKEHQKNHSKRHIQLMQDLMKTGLSFNKSHDLVIKFIK
jgi:hypothetical protein